MAILQVLIKCWNRKGIFVFFAKLEGFAPYGGQTSSSCRRLVAFSHQMGALLAPKWGPFGPPWTNKNTYIAQIQIQIHI